MSKHGIAETQEMITGLMEVTLVMIEVFKDGAQVTDIMLLWQKIGNDPQMRKYLAESFEGYKKIPAEIKDIDPAEAVQMVTMMAMYVPRILDALKKHQK